MPRPHPLSGTLRDDLLIKPVQSKFTPDQVAKYLSAIEHHPPYDAEASSGGKVPVNVESLERLALLHLLAFPFENTTMHYTAEHDIDVTFEGVFHRLVNNRNGSYCFGHNILFLEMLRGLGFRAYLAGVRVNYAPAGSPFIRSSFTHLVLLVQPSANDNRTYLVDVGYGSSGLIRPLLLSADEDNCVYGLNETECHRLTYGPREDSSLVTIQDDSVPAGAQWNLEVGHTKSINGVSQEIWRQQFSFTEAEIWHQDILFVSYGVCRYPISTNVFWNNVVCLKLFTVDEGNLHLEKTKRPMYRIILHSKEVRKSFGAESEIIRKLETEADRIHALREMFGLHINDEDEVHIIGRVPAYDYSEVTE